jgi:phage I-like protein
MTVRAETAENKAKEEAAAMRAEKIDAAIEAARKAGKITPATESYYRDQCAEEGGLEKFAAFVKAAPAIGDPTTNLDKKPDEPAKGPRKPTAEEIEVARACGVTEEVLAKSLQ